MSSLPEEPAISNTNAGDPNDHGWHHALLTDAMVDPAAFAPLYERYKADIYYFCFRRLSHPEEAADATSQIFVKVLRALPTYRIAPAHAGSAFRAWLYSVAQTTIIDLRRRSRPTNSLDVGVTSISHVNGPASERSIEDQLIAGEDARMLRNLLQRLPERQHRIMELRLAGLAGQEIAEAMEISLSAVKSAQFRAVRTLRRLLDETESTTDEGSRE